MANDDDRVRDNPQSGKHTPVPDEHLLRRYMLGQCSPEESDSIELAALRDNEVSDLLSAIQDELTEEYVQGALSGSEKFHLDRSPKNRIKITLTDLLIKKAAKKAMTDRMRSVLARRQELRLGPLVAEYLGEQTADHPVPIPERSSTQSFGLMVDRFNLKWILGTATIIILAAGVFIATFSSNRSTRNAVSSEPRAASIPASSELEKSNRDRIFEEIAIQYWVANYSVAARTTTNALESSTLTEGTFKFKLPDLGTQFVLRGRQQAFLDQTEGVLLLYDLGGRYYDERLNAGSINLNGRHIDLNRHHINVGGRRISVFIFQDKVLRTKLSDEPASQKQEIDQYLNVETWSDGGLRYFVIGDASPADIDSLAKLLKAK